LTECKEKVNELEEVTNEILSILDGGEEEKQKKMQALK
jgi:hypothetical protein